MKEDHETQALHESYIPFIYRYLKLIRFQGSPLKMSKSFEAAQSTLAGIELMHMLRKEQLEDDEFEGQYC